MYIRPVGTNPPPAEDRMPVWQVISGDEWELITYAYLSDGTTPVDPDNSLLTFKLAESRFSATPFFTATWGDGIEEVEPTTNPGLIRITVRQEISNTLRRGGYIFSLLVKDDDGGNAFTQMLGNLLVEYEPTSPNHDIPYKLPETNV